MDIAIIGLDCRFPGAEDRDYFWSLVLSGQSNIGGTGREIGGNNCSSPDQQPDDIAAFDHLFFGYTPREAALLDPQQRVFLESCWRALEDAGHPPSPEIRVGVFAGAGLSTYLLHNVAPALESGDETDNFLAYTANDKDFLATRIAFKLDLQGPAIAVQTACSTGLVAVHMACRSIQLGECDLALAGGVTIRVPAPGGGIAGADGIESPDGGCRPFDAAANGTVFANGVGTVVLKPVEAALADGDRIYAVIKGSAVNNDGAAKASFTAPSAAGQADVIMEALAVADADPASIAFVETHGTGTSLGDAVELAGLEQVFAGCPQASCAIGAVKANIGHTDVAAGIAGLIKAALALHHRTLPPLANWQAAAPDSPLGKGPLFAPVRAQPLAPRAGAIRAGVSAFGVGGTNAHVVLEAAPSPAPAAFDDRPQLLVWSGRDEAARARLTGALAASLTTDTPIADAAWSLQTRRKAMPARAAVAVRDATDACAALAAPKRIRTGSAEIRPRLAFLFPGQGAQFPGMGAALHRQEPLFAATIDAAAAQLAPSLGFDLREPLFAPDAPASRERLSQTSLTQPAMFTLSVAMLRLLADWGIEPDVVIGHSLGEYAAMVAAGVLEFEDALDLVAARGRLMQAMPGGRMAAALAPEAEVRALLAPGAEIAAINSPSDCVVAGPDAAVAATLAALDRAGIAARLLETSHAFHSAMIESMLPEFAQLAAACRSAAPRLPLISNLTGAPLGEATPDYFTAQIRRPVRFGDGIARLLAEGPVIALEVGPGTTLGGLGRRQGLRAYATMPMGGDRQALLDAVGALWCEGFEPDWNKLHRTPRRHADLPLYPFERTRHWIVPSERKPASRRTGIEVLHAGWRRHHAVATALPEGRWAAVGADAEPLVRGLRALGAQAEIGPDAEPCDGLVVTPIAAEALPAILARAIEGGRLRHCLFLLDGLAEVQGDERLDVETARVAGLALALAREHPEIAVRIVDPGGLDRAAMLPQWLAAPMPLSAWRGRSAWVPDFRETAWPPATEAATSGVYLVIGATGLVGRTAAGAIRQARPEAVLYLASRSGNAVSGVEGEPRAVEAAEIKPLVDEILLRHGRLDGVVFAAGSLDLHAFAAVVDPLPEDYSKAKIDGVAALARALESAPCGFVLLCGSLAARLGGVGYGGYAGANLAAASIAANAGESGATPWITLALDAIAGGPLPTAGLAEIPEAALSDLFRQLIAVAPALGSTELIVAPAGFDSRWKAFGAAIGAGAAPAGAAPAAPAEDAVAAAWRAVLGCDPQDEQESFFASGGSSLQALQLLGRLRRELGVELALADFFDAPTIAALHARLGEAPRAAVRETAVRTGPAPLSAGQLGLWLAEQRAESAGRYNITELYRIEGSFDLPAFRAALAVLEARHEVLRTRFVESEAGPVQHIDSPGRVPLHEERIAPEGLEARLDEEVVRRIDLAAEPGWRVVLLDTGADRFLLLSAHHILLDDWSIGLFFEELAQAYADALAGRPSAAPPAPGFTGFCWAQQDALATGEYDALLAAWQERLGDAPRRIGFAPPLAPDPDGAVRLDLDGAAVTGLRGIAERANASLFAVLLATYKLALAAETGSRDLVVGTPLTGRPPGDRDRTLGYFVNPAALRTDLAAAADFPALVSAVKAVVLEASALDQLPHERVAARLEAGPAGLFDAWFTILTHAEPRAMADGLRLEPMRLGQRPSRFALALVLEPQGDGLAGWLEYDGARVGKAAAERIAAAVVAMIARVLADPAAPIPALLGEDERPALRLALPKRTRRRGEIGLREMER